MIHSKNRIGISLRVVTVNNYNEKRDTISQDWVVFLEKLGALPVFIPNKLSDVRSFLTDMKVNGLILSGGDNIGDDPERDRTEEEIIDFGIDHKIPIFGVCRGMQVLNKYFGGSIITNNTLEHVGKPHLIQLTNPKLSNILNFTSLNVNSFHHNIINQRVLGKNLETFAQAKDKTIEGFFHKTFPIMGVMWHPERDTNVETESILVKICQNKTLWNK